MLEVRPSSHKDMRTVGGCRLLRKLSTSDKGDIYLAEQVRLGNRLVAVKIVALDDVDAVNGTDRTREAEQHCLHEAKLLGRFSHPHILAIHDSGYDRGRFYLMTHYVPYGSLADALHGTHYCSLHLPLTVSLATDFVSQIASALQYVHDSGVVHNDVKPDNILIDTKPCGQWHLLLAGFGLARCLDAPSEQAHIADTDTHAYMAPERFAGRAIPASDQYALAVFAFQLLAGHLPFEGDTTTLEAENPECQPPSLRSLNPSVPEPVETVIQRALAQNPDERYPSVEAFAMALRLAAWEIEETPTIPLALGETIGVEPDPDTLVLYPAVAIASTVSDSVTVRTEIGRTRPAIPIQLQTGQIARTSRVTQEMRLLAVGIASLLLLQLVAATSSGFMSTASLHGGQLAKSLVGWAARDGAQPVSHGRVLAPPRVGSSNKSSTDRDDQRPGAVNSDRASPLPQVLALVAPSGQQIAAHFSFANYGKTSWSHAKGYTLACASRRHTHATCLGFTPIGFGKYAVPPGGNFTFTVRLTAPSRVGTYAIWLNVGRNGQLFGTRDMLLTVTTS